MENICTFHFQKIKKYYKIPGKNQICLRIWIRIGNKCVSHEKEKVKSCIDADTNQVSKFWQRSDTDKSIFSEYN